MKKLIEEDGKSTIKAPIVESDSTRKINKLVIVH